MKQTSASRTILVAEDEYFIADVLSEALQLADWHVLGPFSSVASALQALAESSVVVDVAVLDINLNGELVFPLVDRLQRDNTAVILTSGYDVDEVPPAYMDLPRFQKPVGMRELIECAEKLCE